MDFVEQLKWKGGHEPASFPHVCAYRPDGADKQSCIELSGRNAYQNRNGCCGTVRIGARFSPCNSIERRCIVCLELGRLGSSANRVNNILTGTCEEHMHGVQVKRTLQPVRKVYVELAPPIRRAPIPPSPSVQVDRVVEEPPAFEKKRRKRCEKMAALEQAALELREERQRKGDIPQISANQLCKRAATRLRMSPTGLSSYFYKWVPEETRTKWLYGESGRKLTRAEIKFTILLQVREQLRKAGGPPPRKKELAEAAAKPLGMRLDSTRTYIYDRLTPEEVKKLDLRGQFLTPSEQLEVLTRVRREMKDKGLPAPRQQDLAIAAAPLLRQKPSSVRTLIGRLPKDVKEELAFLNSRSSAFIDVDPEIIKEAFMGAIAILRLRKLPLTLENMGSVLRLKPEVVRSYVDEHPDLKKLLDV